MIFVVMERGTIMNGDITYCAADCKNKINCKRNPEKRPFKDMPYWVADFSDTCNRYKRLNCKDNCRS